MAVVGFAVNDSGVAVPALAMAVAVPAAIAVAVRASAPDDAAPPSRYVTAADASRAPASSPGDG